MPGVATVVVGAELADLAPVRVQPVVEGARSAGGRGRGLSLGACDQGCQMAKFDPFLSLDCARVEGVGAQSKERKGSNFAA